MDADKHGQTATYKCDEYGFGSSDWWRCMDADKHSKNVSATYCDQYGYGSNDWWKCISETR
jgi:hypothetical protein